MRSLWSLLFISVLLISAGCGRQDPKFAIKRINLTSEVKTTTDFVSDEMKKVPDGMLYTGTAEAEISNAGLKNRTLAVVFTVKREGKEYNDREGLAWALFQNGRGTIDLYERFSQADVDSGKATEPKFQFAVVGWYELNPGTVTQ